MANGAKKAWGGRKKAGSAYKMVKKKGIKVVEKKLRKRIKGSGIIGRKKK